MTEVCCRHNDAVITMSSLILNDSAINALLKYSKCPVWGRGARSATGPGGALRGRVTRMRSSPNEDELFTRVTPIKRNVPPGLCPTSHRLNFKQTRQYSISVISETYFSSDCKGEVMRLSHAPQFMCLCADNTTVSALPAGLNHQHHVIGLAPAAIQS